MDDETYMSDNRAKSVAGMIEGLTVLSKYFDNGLAEKYFCGGEHDEIFFYVPLDKLPEDSDDGRLLQSLGFHASEDSWAYFT